MAYRKTRVCIVTGREVGGRTGTRRAISIRLAEWQQLWTARAVAQPLQRQGFATQGQARHSFTLRLPSLPVRDPPPHLYTAEERKCWPYAYVAVSPSAHANGVCDVYARDLYWAVAQGISTPPSLVYPAPLPSTVGSAVSARTPAHHLTARRGNNNHSCSFCRSCDDSDGCS